MDDQSIYICIFLKNIEIGDGANSAKRLRPLLAFFLLLLPYIFDFYLTLRFTEAYQTRDWTI